MGHGAAEAEDLVDEIVGWPTVLQLMRSADGVLYL